MSFIELLFLSLSLAIDCFAVSCIIGLSQPDIQKRFIIRFAFFFGLFQGMMPLIGFLLGEEILGYLGKIAPYIAFTILLFLGGKMIIEALKNKRGEDNSVDATKFKNVIILSIATSIDALAVGFSLAVIDKNIIRTTLTIGITSFLISILGYKLSKKLSKKTIGRYAEIVGGIVLILLGVKIIAIM